MKINKRTVSRLLIIVMAVMSIISALGVTTSAYKYNVTKYMIQYNKS